MPSEEAQPGSQPSPQRSGMLTGDTQKSFGKMKALKMPFLCMEQTHRGRSVLICKAQLLRMKLDTNHAFPVHMRHRHEVRKARSRSGVSHFLLPPKSSPGEHEGLNPEDEEGGGNWGV